VDKIKKRSATIIADVYPLTLDYSIFLPLPPVQIEHTHHYVPALKFDYPSIFEKEVTLKPLILWYFLSLYLNTERMGRALLCQRD